MLTGLVFRPPITGQVSARTCRTLFCRGLEEFPCSLTNPGSSLWTPSLPERVPYENVPYPSLRQPRHLPVKIKHRLRQKEELETTSCAKPFFPRIPFFTFEFFPLSSSFSRGSNLANERVTKSTSRLPVSFFSQPSPGLLRSP